MAKDYTVNRLSQVQSHKIGIFQWPQDRQPHPKAVFDHQIDCCGIANIGRDDGNGFSPERVLQAVADKARHIPFDVNGYFPGLLQKIHAPLDIDEFRMRRLDDLDQWNEVWRIPPVGAEDASRVLSLGGDLPNWNDRRIAGQDTAGLRSLRHFR